MGLQCFTVSVDLVVVADDPTIVDHYDLIRWAQEELDNGGTTEHVEEITELRQVPSNWEDALPYGGHDERTVRQQLAKEGD